MPDPEMERLVAEVDALDDADYVYGKQMYHSKGTRVVEFRHPSARLLAIKVRSSTSLKPSEGHVMNFAASNGVRAPKFRGWYDIVMKEPVSRVLVADCVPGTPLHMVWKDYTDEEKESVKEQLRDQFKIMRSLTLPYIGRPNHDPMRNLWDRLSVKYVGPFQNEATFDMWCLSRVDVDPLTKWKWKRWLKKERKTSSGKFVLTHGDLTPRNIIVQGSTITGIIDWERCGFLPEYMEYANAMRLGKDHEKWWLPIIQDLLQPCSEKRLAFTNLVEDPGFTFDDWCIARLDEGAWSTWKWKRWLKKKRKESSGKFALPHGDLTPRNIMAQGSTITGIIDWERSAFLLECAEDAFAMKLCHAHVRVVDSYTERDIRAVRQPKAQVYFKS